MTDIQKPTFKARTAPKTKQATTLHPTPKTDAIATKKPRKKRAKKTVDFKDMIDSIKTLKAIKDNDGDGINILAPKRDNFFALNKNATQGQKYINFNELHGGRKYRTDGMIFTRTKILPKK